ncbi:hypothetical protein C8R45DRAFT_921710 [Mycena sanguinolenta]|nr:hypothetical protein C8R45DRAFT_921710 [Mycena sanguinolenta]
MDRLFAGEVAALWGSEMSQRGSQRGGWKQWKTQYMTKLQQPRKIHWVTSLGHPVSYLVYVNMISHQHCNCSILSPAIVQDRRIELPTTHQLRDFGTIGCFHNTMGDLILVPAINVTGLKEVQLAWSFANNVDAEKIIVGVSEPVQIPLSETRGTGGSKVIRGKSEGRATPQGQVEEDREIDFGASIN